MTEVTMHELERLVEYFYQMDYRSSLVETADPQPRNGVSVLQLHARMFGYAEKYDIIGLRELAIQKYVMRCSKSWDAIEFLESIHEVYENTHESIRRLRDTVTNISRQRLPTMLDDDKVSATYEQVTQDIPDYTRDLLRLFMNAPLYLFCCECNEYQQMEALQTKCRKCKKGGTARNVLSTNILR
jgi:hypothetical protein